MKQIFLISGDDSFAIEAFEKNFAKENVDPEWETFNLEIFDSDNFSIDKIVESADSPPFGFGNKVIIVKRAEILFSGKEELLEPLELLFERNLMSSNFLIFSAKSVDKRRNIIKMLLNVAEQKEFNLMKSWEIEKRLFPWVEDYFRKYEKRIERAATEELVDSCGNDKRRLEMEIEKLLIYIGEEKMVTLNDVRKLVVNTESDLFEFLEFLARKEIGNAINQINKLLLKEPAIKLISSITSNIKTVYNIKILEDSNMNNSDIAKNLDQKPFIVDKNIKLWKSFNSVRIRAILKGLMELDLKFKTSAVIPRLEFEKFIIKNFS